MAEFSSSSAEAETCSENLLAEFSTVVNDKEELKRKNVCEDSSSLNEYRDGKKMRGRQFIESEVELSVDRDEADDCTKSTDRAVYLRSLENSPVFRRSRALPPITEDIFSQAVNEADSENYFEEDRGRKRTNEELKRENRLLRQAISEAERLIATMQAILRMRRG